MTPVDRYLHDLASRLGSTRRRRARIETEVRDHFADAVERAVAAGVSRDTAIANAISAFGEPHEIAAQFNAEAGTQAMRRAPVAVVSAGLLVIGGLFVAAVNQPHAAARTNGKPVAQVAFFAALLAMQVALVAGACAASRALARWRAVVVSADDRAFARRCNLIAIAALTVTAGGWLIALGVSLGTLAHHNATALALGSALMAIGPVAGWLFLAQQRGKPDDVIDSTPVDARGGFGFGEQVIALLRRHALVSCGVVALVSATAAMRHAETTVVGALPWGIAQAASVIGAYLLLGPTLQLRDRDMFSERAPTGEAARQRRST
jgi:hypothetical protein